MKTPFPGMNPWLEHPARWPDVHNSLIIAIRDALSPLVAPNYYVSVESQAYIVDLGEHQRLGRPDVSIVSPIGVLPRGGATTSEQTEINVQTVIVPTVDEVNHYYLEIREAGTHTLITAIEVLSPVNKRTGKGRESYLEKRHEILNSRTSFVEIDLLRAGEPMPLEFVKKPGDYRILVSPSWKRPSAQLVTFNLPAPIPDIGVPLSKGEEAPVLSLNQLVHDLYSRARFDIRIDYSEPAVPPLSAEQQAWANNLLPDA